MEKLLTVFSPEMDIGLKTFINSDNSVDGEIRIGNLPAEWRGEDGPVIMASFLSELIRAWPLFPESPAMGGRFWAVFGLRFGPQNEAELGELAEIYKRHRGMLQLGTYPAGAWHPTPLQLGIVGLKTITESLENKRGIGPSLLFVRIVWTPDGKRPAHYDK
jgi:hypothetical protein